LTVNYAYSVKTTGIRSWHKAGRDRPEWRRIVLEAKVHRG